MPEKNDWQIFAGWKAPIWQPTWEIYAPLIALINHLNADVKGRLSKPLKLWENWRQDNGFNLEKGMMDFKPLRLHREEDWSAWLAFLIEHSATGTFANLCLKRTDIPMSENLDIRLEYTTSAKYRADIVILWQNSRGAHIEVKIGDKSIEKTFATGEAVRSDFKFSRENLKDYILLLDEQVPDWQSFCESNKMSQEYITVITWSYVAKCLRKILYQNLESVLWRAWAFTLTNAIEQKLLGINSEPNKNGYRNNRIYIDILQQGD